MIRSFCFKDRVPLGLDKFLVLSSVRCSMNIMNHGMCQRLCYGTKCEEKKMIIPPPGGRGFIL